MTFEQIMRILAIIAFSIAIYFMIQIGLELQQVAQAFDKSDYCSTFDNGHVEYCLVALKLIPCDSPMEQLLCKELSEQLEK